MKRSVVYICSLLIIGMSSAQASDRAVVSMWDMSKTELKYKGIEVPGKTTFRIRALGAGGDYGWTYKSDDLFAYGWIIDADTRQLVWKMDTRNTSKSGDDREFKGAVTLERGSYEVYFTAYGFTQHKTFSHMTWNIDHRRQPLFGPREDEKKDIFSYFKGWWSDDMEDQWWKRSKTWGIELVVDESQAGSIKSFTPPRQQTGIVFKTSDIKDDVCLRQGFSVSEPTTLSVYALGEARDKTELVDFSWIVNTRDRRRVWEMDRRQCEPGGGATKNVLCARDIRLDKGDYVLYCITDDSHSPADWNAAPPYDPLNWGITLSVRDEHAASNIRKYKYNEDENLIVRITKVGDNESRNEGFTLKEDAKVRILAFGERSNSRRLMADYGYIMDPVTRTRVWTMDVDRVQYAGGASKNCYIDEIIELPRGSYVVGYVTDDSHAFGEWNSSPPFDPERYGITVMGGGKEFSPAVVGKYVEQRDKNTIARIARAGNSTNMQERFVLDKTTRVRIYAIGEGMNREMYDYGWIEDAGTGKVIWEMTYSMSFHAGGHRKNRMVNTTILLEKGEYRLRYTSDDSHAYGKWNVDPPDDREFWGITLYRDEGSERPLAPLPPKEQD